VNMGSGVSVAETVLEANGLSKRFPGVDALKGVSLSVACGQVHCLIGENGAGKSTFVKVLAGVHKPDAGEIRVRGQLVHLDSPQSSLRRGISTIFQELSLVSGLTVAENVFLGRAPTRMSRLILNGRERSRLTAGLFRELGVTDIPVDEPVRNLGIAHQQIVEIIKAMSLDHTVLLVMDEPTASLAQSEVQSLFRLTRRLRARGIGILYISHRLDELAEIGDLVTVMRDGAVVARHSIAAVSQQQMIEEMVGRRLDDLYPPRGAELGDVLLDVKDMSVPGSVADVSMQLRAGEVVAIFGLVGSGRTEAVRALVGADSSSKGRVTVAGRRLTARQPQHALAAGIGLVPEDRKGQGIVPLMSVADNIGLSSLRRLSVRGVFLRKRRSLALALTLVRRLKIKASDHRQPLGQLSGGNQQKAIIARLLAADLKVVILDEPTRGIDVGSRTELYRIIGDLRNSGKGVLMVTSDLPEALGMSDRIIVFRRGRVMGEVSSATASEESVMRLAFGVRDLPTAV
jgi:ribose transport system ATP-binding protein